MMSTSNPELKTLKGILDLIGQPMFLLDVEGPSRFVFRGLNRNHMDLTGLDDGPLLGKSPHEVFPTRLADTIVKNYEACRAQRAPYTYEEILELPSGARWWQTTLTPIFDDGGQVVRIIGLAFDISERKEAEFTASAQLSEMTRLNEDLQVFVASTAQDMRGPFQTMVALLDMVMDGFVDLGDEKLDQLTLCSEIAQDAIRSMKGILDTAHRLQVVEKITETVDVGHIASDIVALLDPDQRLNIELTAAEVETDRVAMQMVLRNVLENAVRYADRMISLEVSQHQDGVFKVIVADDGVGQTNNLRSDGSAVIVPPGNEGAEFGMSSAQAIVRSRGGVFGLEKCPFSTGAAISFTLPGRVVVHDQIPSSPRPKPSSMARGYSLAPPQHVGTADIGRSAAARSG